MSKLTLNTLTAGRASIDLMNANFTLIQDAFDKCLFLDGTVPNSMNTDLGMNSHRIINILNGTNPQDAATVQQLQDLVIASGNSTPTISPTAPAGSEGIFWLDTSGSSMVLYLYAEGSWIDVTSEAGMSALEIKALYESNLDTNPFTDSQVTDVAAGAAHVATITGNPHQVQTVETSDWATIAINGGSF